MLGLPDYFKFGIELEADNVETKGEESLYTGESAKVIKEKNWHMATKMEESLVGQGGAELVSPVLRDTPDAYKGIFEMCEQMKKFPKDKQREVEANEKCGLHIHFDADCLLRHPEKMRQFLEIYAESEELIYKMCNAKNNPIRKNAIKKDFKGLHIISALWRNGMAAPSGKKILKQLQAGSLKPSYKNWGKLSGIIAKYKIDERRYHGLNLTNLGNPKKNTIEFRMANGTLDSEIIKQNIFFYASIINTAIKSIEYPDRYKEKLKAFYKTDISEEEKAKSFLELIIEEPEDRQIYFERWESVKDNEIFQKNRGFSQNRFKKEDFETIAKRTSALRVKQTYSKLKQMIGNTKEKTSIKKQGEELEYYG